MGRHIFLLGLPEFAPPLPPSALCCAHATVNLTQLGTSVVCLGETTENKDWLATGDPYALCDLVHAESREPVAGGFRYRTNTVNGTTSPEWAEQVCWRNIHLPFETLALRVRIYDEDLFRCDPPLPPPNDLFLCLRSMLTFSALVFLLIFIFRLLVSILLPPSEDDPLGEVILPLIDIETAVGNVSVELAAAALQKRPKSVGALGVLGSLNSFTTKIKPSGDLEEHGEEPTLRSGRKLWGSVAARTMTTANGQWSEEANDVARTSVVR